MAESGSAGSTTTTSTTGTTNGAASAGATGSAPKASAPSGASQSAGGKAGASGAQPKTAATSMAPAGVAEAIAEELEEIKLGSLSGKVPKAFAKAIKDLERGFHGKAQTLSGMERAFEAAKTNPQVRDALLQKMGVDKYEFAEMTLTEKLEQLSLSPEQQRLRELESYRENVERQKAQVEAQRQQKEHQAQVQAHQASYNKAFVDAWQTSGLPPDPVFAQMLAAEMVAAQGRQEKLSWSEAAAKLVTKVETFFPRILEAMDPERFERVLGSKSIDRIRELALRRVTQAAPTANSGLRPDGKKAPVTSTGKKAKSSHLSEKEWDMAMRKRAGT